MSIVSGHRISIPSLLRVGKGTLGEIGTYLKDNKLEKVVVYFGNGLIDMFGYTVLTSMNQNGVEVLEYKELDTIHINDIIDLAFSINPKTQAVLGIGGGKVIDTAKYVAFLRKLPFISVPTSSSSDGFSSSRDRKSVV